jgi:hypothetical protein
MPPGAKPDDGCVRTRQDPRSVEISKRAGDMSSIAGDFIIYPRCYPQLGDWWSRKRHRVFMRIFSVMGLSDAATRFVRGQFYEP